MLSITVDEWERISNYFLSVEIYISIFCSHAYTHARIIIMCLLFPSFSLPFIFMFYNTFANQRLTKKISFYSKIIPDIFCLYCKKVYFCIRLARGAKLLSLTYWKRGLPTKLLNKKTSKKIWFQCLKVLIFAVRFANKRRFFLCRFFLLSQESC